MSDRIAYLPADEPPASSAAPVLEANRDELELRRAVRGAWIAIAVGVIVPVIALWGAVQGWHLRRVGHPHGALLLALGATVFLARLAAWLLTRG